MAIARHVVIGGSHSGGTARAAHSVRVVTFPQLLGSAGSERINGRHENRHHAVAVAIEQLSPCCFPDGISAAIVRDLGLGPGPGNACTYTWGFPDSLSRHAIHPPSGENFGDPSA